MQEVTSTFASVYILFARETGQFYEIWGSHNGEDVHVDLLECNVV